MWYGAGRWPEVVQLGGSIPCSRGMMNICGRAPGVVICCLNFVTLCVPGFSLKHLLAWLIYQLCYDSGIGLRLYRIAFLEMAFFTPIFLVYFPRTSCCSFSLVWVVVLALVQPPMCVALEESCKVFSKQ